MKPFRLLLLLPFLVVSCAPAPDSSTVLSTNGPAKYPVHGSVTVGVGTDPDYVRHSHSEL